MRRQIRLLTQITLCNLLGLNELRFARDKRKKTRYYLMGGLGCLVLVMLAVYVGGAAWGLVYLGAGDLVAAALAMGVSLIVFLFTMVKAGPVLFDQRAFEKQIVLPVDIRAVIASRFFSMYVTDMLLGLLGMLPGVAVYGFMERPGITFYLYGLAGSVFLPLLPLTAASLVGALITGIGSRWKRKNLAMIVLTMIFVGVVLAGSMGMARMDESGMEETLRRLAPVLREQISRLYPPAIWLSEAMTEGKISSLILFALLPLGCLALFLEILQRFYGKICALLSAGGAKAGEGYKEKELAGKSPLISMTRRELRRYFSSVVYVTNTLVGEMMMVILAAAVSFTGTQAVDGLLGLPGMTQRALPVLLGIMPAMMPTTASAISMEGRQWWMMQTFPVREKDLMRSKVLVNLLVAAPFYLASELALLFALRPGGADAVFLLIVPALYILFGAEAGLAVNRRLPVFDWENETRVVKQSASTFVMVVAGVISGGVPLGILLGFPMIPARAVYALTAAALGMAAVGLEFAQGRGKQI